MTIPFDPASGVHLLDGGLGTGLMARGLAPGEPPEGWNVERPADVLAVHRGFLRAGSRVIQTNTFGANRLALRTLGLEGRCLELNRAATLLARQAVEDEANGGPRWVAGNLGPLRRPQPPDPLAGEREGEAAFAEQAEFLVESGVDFLAVETMTSLAEARCALRGAARTGRPVTVCLTVRETPRGFLTLAGEPLGEAVPRLAADGAAAVGVNCSEGSAALLRAVPTLLENAPVPVIVKPNAGRPPESPAGFAGNVARMVALGARLAGGCCGTDGRHLRALGDALAHA